MTLPAFVFAAFVTSFLTGVLGAILGLGGGILLVPILTLAFGLDIRYAVGASVVAVIATSSGAALAYLRDRLTNVRIGMLLLLGATAGTLTGAMLSGWVEARWLYLLFGLLMFYTALAMYRSRHGELSLPGPDDALSRRLGLGGQYYDQALGRHVAYQPRRTLSGVAALFLAGILGGLLGIGGGAFNVLAMDQLMRLPLKVASATSNFLIGVAAAASAAVYLSRGQVEPSVAAPVALGVLAGAVLGARLMVRLQSRTIRLVFVPILLWVAAQMFWKGWGL